MSSSALSTTIHPSAFVGEGVDLGVGVSIGPGAVLLGPMQVGDRVWIGTGCALGAPPEISSKRHNLAWAGDLDHFGVVIEADAVLRELVVVHQGSHRPTIVGAGAWLLNRSYVAHDVQTGPSVFISAGVSIGGHCTIRSGANLGMNACVHQGRRIGSRAMIGMGATVARDVPPFAKAYGVPLRIEGVNVVGMRRAGISAATIDAVVAAYTLGRTDVCGLPDVADEFDWWAGIEDRRDARFGDAG